MIRSIFLIPLHITFVLLIIFFVFGCATHGKVIVEDDGGLVSVEVNSGPTKGHYESKLPNISPSKMPPPGKCRLWLPGKYPVQQPPPGDCNELRQQMPPGVWLIRGKLI